jgi:hypothetical protein
MMASDEPPFDSSPPGRSTHFVFEHAVFRTPDSRFVLASDGTPSLMLRLADLDAVVPIRALGSEFALGASGDAALLDLVVAGLRHVKTIRPGDSIPREILDGTASWTVEDRHVEIAKGRITLQISSWLTGQEQVISDQLSLLQLADDPAVKARVNEAFGDIAVKLGLPPENRQDVVDRIDLIVRELAYIEALRERYQGTVLVIRDKILQFHKIYRRDRSIEEEFGRIESLIRRPVTEFAGIFDQIDAQCGEIISLMRNLDRQIPFIREGRDELHRRMMLWDDIIPLWVPLPVERSAGSEQAMKALYRFLARNFITVRPWQLASAAFERKQ